MNLPSAVEVAIKNAASSRGLSRYLLLMKDSHRILVEARREVFLELRRQGYSLAWISRWFDMSHTTVLHHLKSVRDAPRVRSTELVFKTGRQDRYCDRCGFRGTDTELKAEGYHFVCRDLEACGLREERYWSTRKFLAARFRAVGR